MTNKNILIGTPMYGGMCTHGYTSSLILLILKLIDKGYGVSYQFINNESLITRARNDIVHAFLKLNATHLLFVDADITFNADDIIRMIDADKDIVCGTYPKKEIRWDNVKESIKNNLSDEAIASNASEYSFNFENEENKYIVFGEDKLVEVKNAGTGCMLIKKNVFDTLSSKVSTYTNNSLFKGEETKEYFTTSIDPNENIMLSEDYHFCKLWKNENGKIYVASWVKLKHTGTYTFG